MFNYVIRTLLEGCIEYTLDSGINILFPYYEMTGDFYSILISYPLLIVIVLSPFGIMFFILKNKKDL